ncbi:MAG: DUF4350 domain-containing protein [Myxococcota bacterium]|nr:DUF4350 domain-containing protein [Myxococcota bacterium]
MKRSRQTRARQIMLALAFLCLATPSQAQEPAPGEGATDEGSGYALESGDWDGLRDFITLAKGEEVEVVTHTSLDYNELSLEEPLLIVYPKQALRAGSLSRFIIDGGNVILADDFGESDALLDRLSVSRIEPMRGALPHGEFLERNPALPVVRARGVHPLLKDVQFVVGNHPAVLYNIGGPVLGYSEDGGLVYDMNFGEGKAIVVADSSMLINHMLLVGDNDQFWRNALSYACVDVSPCKLHVYVGAFEQTGSWGSEDDILGNKEEISEKIASFNESLDDMMQRLPAEQLFYYLGILLALGLILYLYTIFPMRRTRPYSAYLSDAQASTHPPQSEFDWNLSRFVHGASAMNYALPVSILKEVFEELFLREMGFWDGRGESGDDAGREQQSANRPKVPELADMFTERYMDVYTMEQKRKMRQQLTELLATFAQVPTRHRVFLDSDTYFSERDLLRVHKRSLEILDIMGLKEEYERRTRSNI